MTSRTFARLAEHATGRRFTVWVLLGLVLLPAVISASFAWTQKEATEHLDRIEAAVVNNDQAVTVDGQYIPLGRVLVANLTDPTLEDNLTWTNTDSETAAEGLRTGRFATVVTIPQEFSAAATSLGGEDPTEARQATLAINTSPAAGVIDPTIAKAVAAAVTDTLNTDLTETFVDRVFLGFSTLKEELGAAVDGAGELSDGAGQLHEGLGEAAAGADELHGGLVKLDAGADDLAAGADKLATGSDELADGLATMRAQTRDLPKQTARLADGADQLRDGVNTAAEQLQAVLDRFEDANLDTDQAARLLEQAATVVDGLSGPLAEAEEQCAAEPVAGCEVLEPIRNLVDQQTTILTLLQQAVTMLDEMPDASAQLEEMVAGVNALADGTAELAAGMSDLADGIDQAADGARQVADGNARLADGAGQLAEGTERAADGSGELAGGVHRLHEGAGALSAGARQLHIGLRDGVAQIPDYDAAERKSVAQVAAEPVETGALGLPDPKLASAYFAAVALAVAALVLFTLLRAMPLRTLTSSSGSWALAWQAYRPAVIVAALQAVVVGLGMWLAVDLPVSVLAGYAGVVFLAALAMAAVVQGLVALLGGVGRFIAVVALAVSAATAVVTSTPAALRVVVELTPVAPTIQALRNVVVGVGVGAEAATLVGWLIAGLVVTVIAIGRTRTVAARDVAALAQEGAQ